WIPGKRACAPKRLRGEGDAIVQREGLFGRAERTSIRCSRKSILKKQTGAHGGCTGSIPEVLLRRRLDGGSCRRREDIELLRRRRRRGRPKQPSLHLEVFCRVPAAIVDDFVLDLLVFIERGQPGALDRRDMHEHVRSTARRLNEAVA